MLFRFWIEVTASRRKRRVALADLVNVKPVNTDRQTGKGRLNSHTIGRFGERRATHDLASLDKTAGILSVWAIPE